MSDSYSITSAPSITQGGGTNLSFDELTSLLWQMRMVMGMNNPFDVPYRDEGDYTIAKNAFPSTCIGIRNTKYMQ